MNHIYLNPVIQSIAFDLIWKFMDLKHFIVRFIFRKLKRILLLMSYFFREYFFWFFIGYTSLIISTEFQWGTMFFGSDAELNIAIGIKVIAWIFFFISILRFKDFHDLRLIIYNQPYQVRRLPRSRYDPGIEYSKNELNLYLASFGAYDLCSNMIKNGELVITYENALLESIDYPEESISVIHHQEKKELYIKDFDIKRNAPIKVKTRFNKRPDLKVKGLLKDESKVIMDWQKRPNHTRILSAFSFLIALGLGGGILLIALSIDLLVNLLSLSVSEYLSLCTNFLMLFLLLHFSFLSWSRYPDPPNPEVPTSKVHFS